MNRSGVRKLILCILVLAVCTVPAVYINRIYGYLPVLMAVILIAGSYVYMRLLRRALRYEEVSAMGSCIRGTRIDFSVNLTNRSILFFPLVEPFFYIADLFGTDDVLTSDIITLGPREKRSFEFDARFDHIGTYSAGLRKIRLQDMLGLFTHTITNDKRYTVNVVPRIYEIEKLPVSRRAVSESHKVTTSTPLDSSDYAGVREYVIGDPIKNIHWKLSARTSGYMTKIFESYSNTGICIILDFHAPVYTSDALMSIFDCVVETALSVGTWAVREGLESEMLFYDKHGDKAQISSYEKESFTDMMRSMPRIHTRKDRERAVDLLIEEGHSLYSQGNLAFCTADITDELIEALIGIKNQRKNPMLFAVVPDDQDGKRRAQTVARLSSLDDSGVWYYVLSDASELEGGDLS